MAADLGVTILASPGVATPNLQTGMELYKTIGGDRSPWFGYTPAGTGFQTFQPP